MKRLLYVILVVHIFFTTYSQVDVEVEESDSTETKIDPNDRSFMTGWLSGHDSWDIHGGFFYFDIGDLNQKIPQGHTNKFEERLSSFGLSYKGTGLINRHLVCESHLTYQLFIPTNYSFSDSLHYKFQGYQIGMNFGKDLFPRSNLFDLFVGIGFNAGRFKLLQKDLKIADKFLKYTNPFFSPKISLEPKIVTNSFSFSIIGEYLFDVSNPNWHVKDSRLSTLGITRSTGFFVQFCLGLQI
jgi:hypothetical protein